MTQIHTYLTFNGNCREAMVFYQQCLGGELVFQTIGDSPLSETMPQRMKDCILHAVLKKDNLILMGSDMVGEEGLKKGNSVSLIIECVSEAEARVFYEKLAVGGQATQPLADNFWGGLFGGLTDRFGNHWLLHVEANKS